MDKVRYIISDAAQMINVEEHVLRYWEKELELQIPRNELGHRYYTKENMEQFLKIREWKEQGYQLKTIKMMLHGSYVPEVPSEKVIPMPVTPVVTAEQKMEQFQALMTGIVKKAIEENNQALGLTVSEQVGEKVLKEMNYLFREQEEITTEQYRKLDEAIRAQMKGRKVRRKERKKEPSLQPKMS